MGANSKVVSRIHTPHEEGRVGKFSAAIGGHYSGTPGLAQSLEKELQLGQTGRVVGPRRPGGADAVRWQKVGLSAEGRLDGGLRLIESIKLSEGRRPK